MINEGSCNRFVEDFGSDRLPKELNWPVRSFNTRLLDYKGTKFVKE